MSINSRFDGETSDVILNRMLDEISNNVDKRQGSVAYDLLSPAAIELANAYMSMDNVLSYAFISPDMPSDLLTIAAGDFGVFRKPAVKAEGVVTFTGPTGTVIPAGTQVRTDDLIYFETDVEVTLVGGQFSAEVFAIDGGISGNILQFELTSMVGPLAGIVEVTNPFDFSGGVDEETDEDLYQRLVDKIRNPAVSGNIYHYEQWAKEVPGVGDALVIPLWDGPGTVKVVLLGADKKSPGPSIIEDAEQHINLERPIGADVTVVGAEEVYINISSNVSLFPGTDISTVISGVEDALSNYLESIAFKESTVRYSRIASILLEVTGVVDYDDLLINGGTSNIIIDSGKVAISGTVSLVAV